MDEYIRSLHEHLPEHINMSLWSCSKIWKSDYTAF